MKVLYQDLPFPKDSSINFYTEDLPHFIVPWHAHPEIEIMYITHGYGTRFVGDHIGGFERGDICIVGSNLPHEWRNDPIFFEKGAACRARCDVLFFRKEVFDSPIMYLPEMNPIRVLIDRANRGIRFDGESRMRIERKLRKVRTSEGISKLTGLVELLSLMAREEHYTLLASVGFTNSINSKDFDRFNKIYEYLVRHYTEHITLEEISSLVGMTPPAFCKYFKDRTKTTFIKYLNGMRLGYAKKMLIDGKHKISTIAYEAGFNNISHFIEQFKTKTGMLPREYQEKFGVRNRIAW